MKVTLLYPGIAGIFGGFAGFNTAGRGMDSGWISHGLVLIGAALKQAGFDTDLIDLRACTGWDHFAEILRERQPRVVAITMMSVDYNPAMRSIDIIKEVLPSTVVVVGGAHPNLALDEVAANPKIDHIMLREGEISFPELCAKIERGQPSQRIITGKTPDLDAIPFADRDLFLNEWRRAGYTLNSPEVPFADLPAPFVTIISGRGCMYNCSFCMPSEKLIFGKRVRTRSVGNVIAELEQLRERYNFQSMLVHDDCLTEDPRWVHEFCEQYVAHGFTQPWWCQTRADILVRREDMVQEMVKAHLDGVFIGFESGSDRVLKFLRKGTKVEHNLAAGKVCKKYGIRIWANYMMGVPTETKDEVLATIKMLKEIDPDYYSPSFYTPHPGSDLFDYIVENDISLITNHDSYRRNPTEIKIKGQDYDFLLWALQESQRRKPINALRRNLAAGRQRLRRVTPQRVARKLGRLATSAVGAVLH